MQNSTIKKILLGFSLVFVVSILFNVPMVASGAQNSLSFPSPVNLSSDSFNAQYPMVANSGNNVYVVWTEQSHGVYLRISTDGGITWTPPTTSQGKRLSLTGGVTSYPVITVNGS